MKYSMYCEICGHKIKVFEDSTSDDEITSESRENFKNYAKEHLYEMIPCEVCGSSVTLTPELADQFTYVDIAPDDTMSKDDHNSDDIFADEPKFADLESKEK